MTLAEKKEFIRDLTEIQQKVDALSNRVSLKVNFDPEQMESRNAQLISNCLKSIHDTCKATINNLR